MRDRSSPVARTSRPRGVPAGACSVDLVCCSLSDRRLSILVRDPTSELPWVPIQASAPLTGTAESLAGQSLGRSAAWLAQLGAYGDDRRHPSGAPLSVAFVAVVPAGSEPPAGTRWVGAGERSPLDERQRMMVQDAVRTLRDRMDVEPVAFRLLPAKFTLSQLQEVYEVLLGRRLHKASFRRALAGASLIAATEDWRSEGRGRPARLYRYAPKRGKARRRPVRFESLG